MSDSQNLNIDLAASSQESRDKLSALCEEVFDKRLEDLDEISLTELLALEMDCWPTKINVSATATRRTKIQYCTNSYFAAIEIDCSGTKETVLSILKQIPKEKKLDKYFELKRSFYKILELKYGSNEHFCRMQLNAAVQKDNLEDTGRFGT